MGQIYGVEDMVARSRPIYNVHSLKLEPRLRASQLSKVSSSKVTLEFQETMTRLERENDTLREHMEHEQAAL